LKEFRSHRRIEKITSVIKSRQHSLRVVLENIHDPHNVSAIFRTCDAVGVPNVSLIYNSEKFPKIGKRSSASARKWIEIEKHSSVNDCYHSLRKEGFVIYSSSISEESTDLYKLNFKKKVAIVFGNEHRGVSSEAAKLSDKRFKIPMYGMVQSLNVSVAAAIVLYEALRQRMKKGFYNMSELSESEMNSLIEKWAGK
jgi:tRNA (guanosine-2'-O-)-methyltransferase